VDEFAIYYDDWTGIVTLYASLRDGSRIAVSKNDTKPQINIENYNIPSVIKDGDTIIDEFTASLWNKIKKAAMSGKGISLPI
jgi:hypothetical protein